MSPARGRKILLAAIAISLLLHLVLAGYVRWPVFMRPSGAPPPVQVRIIRLARIPKRRPSPPPTPAPVATPRVRSSIAPPRLRSHKGAHSHARRIVAVLPVARTPKPSPTRAPRVAAGCVNPNAEPQVIATPPSEDIPATARASKVSGTAAVQVALDAQGNVTGATLEQTSGNAGLDAVALDLARAASYSPAFTMCKAVAGTYTFTVRFVAW